jgi:hypothetical protein
MIKKIKEYAISCSIGLPPPVSGNPSILGYLVGAVSPRTTLVLCGLGVDTDVGEYVDSFVGSTTTSVSVGGITTGVFVSTGTSHDELERHTGADTPAIAKYTTAISINGTNVIFIIPFIFSPF